MNSGENTRQHSIQLIECPRDAMQGWVHWIPTEKKIAYINALLRVGFNTIDFGSFVSPKAIPQMSDTKEVIKNLRLEDSRSALLAIVANLRGAEEALAYETIAYLGFPFSISQTFQQRNTNSTIEESLKRVEDIQNICISKNKKLVIYLSMGFGNPYGDEYNEGILLKWADRIASMGIDIISLADTVGLATPVQIKSALEVLIPAYPSVTFGVHLHSHSGNWKEKLDAALLAGCIRFDGALMGVGGCPMAQNDLIGNMDSEKMIAYFEAKQQLPGMNKEALKQSISIASSIFKSEADNK